MLTTVIAGSFSAGAALIGIGNRMRRVTQAEARELWIKYFSYAGIVSGMMLCAMRRETLTAALLILGAMCIREVIGARAYGAVIWIATAVWSAIATCKFLEMYIVVAASDAFAQLGGRLLRGPRLMPSLSPHKTISGSLCGGTVGVVIGFFVGLHVDVAAALVLAGLAGDLLASWIKRRAGIKDFSRALPGQGGFMDRFDSLWGAAPLGALLC